MNKLSTFYKHISEAAAKQGWDIETAMKQVKSYGVDYVEIQYGPDFDAEETGALLERCRMQTACVCANFDFLHDSRELSAEKYQRVFEAAKTLACNKVLCIPGMMDEERDHAEQMACFAERITEMCEVAKAWGITVLVEDFDNEKSPCCKMADLKYLLEHVPGLQFAFDTGNFRYCREELGEAYELLKKYVAHVHLKDRGETAPKGESEPDFIRDTAGDPIYTTPVGDGDLKLKMWIRRLIEDGFEGIFVLEHFGAKDQNAYIRRSAENVTAVMEDI